MGGKGTGPVDGEPTQEICIAVRHTELVLDCVRKFYQLGHPTTQAVSRIFEAQKISQCVVVGNDGEVLAK